MLTSKRLAILVVLVMVASTVLAACGPEPEVIIQTVPVEVTKIVQEAGAERTVVETVMVEREVTAVPPTEVPPTPLPERVETDTVVFAMQQEPDTLHPLITSMTASTQVLGALIMGCMAQNEAAEWVNLGCEGDIPNIDNGGAVFVGEGTDQHMEITHKIRDGWRWSDGTPVTTADVVYTWKLIMDPEFQIPARDTTEKIYTIEVVDDQNFIVKMMSQDQVRAAAAGTLEGEVDFAAFQEDYVALGYEEWVGPVVDPIYWAVGVLNWLPAHVLQDVPAAEQPSSEFARNPLSDSPYVLKEWRAGQEIVLEASDLPFPLGEPAIKNIIFRFYGETSAIINALKNGEVDAVMSSTGGLTVANAPDLDPIEAEGVYDVSYAPDYAWEHIDFNVEKWPLSDPLVRKALYHAIDKQQLVDTLYYGKQGTTDLPIPKGLSWAYTEEYVHYPYDPAKAQELLAEAGWDCSTYPCSNAEGQNLEFTLMTTDRADRQALAQVIQQMWKALNVGVNIQFLYGRGLFSACSAGGPLYCGSYDAAIYTVSTGDDPAFDGSYTCQGIPTAENNYSGQNFPRWCNTEADAAIAVAEKDFEVSLSREQRFPYYEEFFYQWTNDVPVIPLFSNTRVWAARSGFENLKPGPTQYSPETWNCWEWTLEK
ncbi:MAG: peptide ABC transporter substrate-binding protein [Anaerolineae bacterium]